MSSSAAPSGSAEHLLSHLGWVQALARQLAGDPELAEDVAQETCVVALERRPSDGEKLRSWLASVVRNRILQHQRSEGRRRFREAASTRDEALASTSELVEQASAQREVVACVLELDEPYRSTVLLRWFRDLPPREIARLQAVPVSTVQSRLQRAHDKLRARLDEAYGTRSTWSVCFLPALAQRAGGLATPTTLGTLFMKLQLVCAAALVAAGAAVYWIVERPLDPTIAAPSAALDAPPAERASARPQTPSLGGADAPPAPERSAVATPGSAPAAPSTTASEKVAVHTVVGRLLGGDGQPLAGLPIGTLAGDEAGESLPAQAPGSEPGVRSDSGGNFRFDTTRAELTLVVTEPGWVNVREGKWKRGSAVEAVIVAAPMVDLAGRVVDEAGAPIANAFLTYRMPPGFSSRFTQILDGSRERSWGANSDAGGAFGMPGMPAVEGATLMASQDGYLPGSVEVPRFAARDLELVLTRPSAPLEGTLRGRVVDSAGGGLAGARVSLGLACTLSDKDGGFAIDLARAVTSERLSAIQAGYQPAVLSRPAEPRMLDDGTQTTGWPDFVVLALVEPARSMGGIVLDHEGRPKAGVKVWLDDPTPFAPIGMMPATVEGLAAGAPIPPQALESEANVPERDGDSFWDWTTPARSSSVLWSWVQSDGDGRFELPGLCDRSYRLCALDSEAMRITRTPPIEAGRTDVEIRLEKPVRAEKVAGRVRTERGDPVAGASLELWLPVVERGSRVRGGNTKVILTQDGQKARTDEEGRFVFEKVPAEHIRVDIQGDEVVPVTLELDEHDDLGALDLVVSVRCHLQVELGHDPERADSLSVTTEDGGYLDLLVISHESVNAFTHAPLTNGKSGVISTSSQARRLRLHKDGVVVEEHSIELLPGVLNELRF